MRNGWMGTLVAWLAGAGLALAQPAQTAPVSAPPGGSGKPRDLASFIAARLFTAPPAGATRPTATMPLAAVEAQDQPMKLPDKLPVPPPPMPQADTPVAPPPKPQADVPVAPPPSPVVPPVPPMDTFPLLPAPKPLPESTPLADVPPAFEIVADGVVCSDGRYWTSAEFLIWHIQRSPLSTPLVTSASLSLPATTAYFNVSDLSFGNNTGTRLSTGYWFNSRETHGLEWSGFITHSPGVYFQTTSTQLTTPPMPLARPFNDAQTLSSQAFTVALVGLSSGTMQVIADSRLWGNELNLVRNCYRTDTCRFELLAGFRQLDLTEDLSIQEFTQGLTDGTLTFLGNPVQASSALLVADRFYTRNQFFGLQVGTRAEYHLESLTFTAAAKLGLGNTHESLTVNGNTSLVGPGVTLAPGGVLALPTNIGRVRRDEFAVVPQLSLGAGYQPGKHCRFFVGYDLLFWSRTVRPGDQIDPTLNQTLIPSSSEYGTFAGPASPRPRFVERGFWAHGLDLGLEIRY